MFFCDPWNPVPFQSRPGLLNDPNASPQQWDNYGCFDQVSVPPVYIARMNPAATEGVLLVRKMRGGASSGGSGWLEAALLDAARDLFGQRLGEFMWREFRNQEFCWNRGGVGHGGGQSKGYAVWEQFPNPAFWASPEELAANNVDPEDADALTEFFKTRRRSALWLGANIAHYKNVWDTENGDKPPSPFSLSAWRNSRIPYDPDFDWRDGNPLAENGYAVWAEECIEIEPGPWGRYQAPNMMRTIRLAPRKFWMSQQPLILTPVWS